MAPEVQHSSRGTQIMRRVGGLPRLGKALAGAGRATRLLPRRSIVGTVAAASLTLAALPLAAVATAGSASAAAAGALSCNGSIIYSVERGSSASSTGTLNALTTGTVGGSSVTATAISSIPAGGNANALGITDGGTGAYLVDQTTSSANSARIHFYAAA